LMLWNECCCIQTRIWNLLSQQQWCIFIPLCHTLSSYVQKICAKLVCGKPVFVPVRVGMWDASTTRYW